MLTLALDDFTWERPAGRKKGFTWEGDGETLRLVEIPDVAFEKYQPHRGLYRDFADLPETPEAVLRFANRYGPLGTVLHVLQDGPLRERSESRFTDLVRDIQWMKKMVALADAVAAGDLDSVQAALGPLSCLEQIIFGCGPDPHRLTPDEVATVAARRLYEPMGASVHPYPLATWNAKGKAVHVRLRYFGLKEFMYGQLCIALIGGRHFHPCAVCGKWFWVTPGVNRADRTTCSPSCRFTAYRRRRQRAVELYAAGWNVKRIARELGSDVEKVKQWVAKRKG
jgi:hypothetical protein